MPEIYSIADANIAANAAIKASKLINPRTWTVSLPTGTAIVAANFAGPIIRGTTATLVGFHAAISGIVATGADRTVTIDFKKSTGGGAFATVLSSTIVFNNGSTALVDSAGTLASSSMVDGDLLQITVAVAGAAGNQAQGLACCAFYIEDYA